MRDTIITGDNTKFVCTPKEVVRVILSQESSVFEKRVQAISFISEIQWILENHEKLSDSFYQRTGRGVYSPEIRSAMNDIDNLYSRVAYMNGYRTEKFSCKKVDVSIENPQKREPYEVIKSVCEDVESMSNRDLMQFCIKTDYVWDMNTGEKIDLYKVADDMD